MDYISNNQYKYLIKIIKNSHFSRKEQKVFVEGLDLVKELIKNNKKLIEYVIVTPDAHNKIKGVDTYLIKESGVNRLSSRISGFEAAVLVNTKPLEEKPFPDEIKGKYLGLLEVQDPFNVGTIFRTAEAFDFKGIFIFKGTADPMNQKVLDSSIGSVLSLDYYKVDRQDKFFEKYKDVQVIGTDAEGELSYKKLKMEDSAIILFGNEGRGLSEKTLEKTDQDIKVPIKNIDSLNLGVTAGIICSHFSDIK